ncbi:ABC transporter substrate-binding protein [Ectothiorhodospira shaposhnikovii]|uniref:heme/hemin ABC transporter substrate-binding protein n=1 Tax=Ectothiorhodospira shaposhnikovii TaxID=1054 RepID=UPI001902C630|nr:ABC transporter substrate-binding protein [Ectothiorhodospira shaposhnikovii]MBK1674039.1 ABC transporter substrate-binding protein [Ectothiorhodospira shaposhnikovii]
MHRRELLRLLGGMALTALPPGLWAMQPPADGGLSDQHRLITIGGGLTETVFALGAGDRIVGTDSTSTFPAAAEALPRVGYQHTLTIESLLALRPHALIHDGSAGPEGTLTRAREAGVRILTVSGEPSMEGFRSRVHTLGQWLDATETARRIIDDVDEDLERSRDLQAEFPRPPAVVALMAHGQGNAVAAGRDTKADALIRLAGGRNVFTDFAGYRPVSREGVMAKRPDALVITGAAAADFGGMLGQVPQYVEDTLFLLGFGPRLGEAVLAVTRFLGGKPPAPREAAITDMARA